VSLEDSHAAAETSAAERMSGEGDEALGQFLIALRARGFRSQRLMEAVERAPRGEFVRPAHVGFAYQDISLPLPFGQETGRPFAIIAAVVALELEPHHTVLEVGTGSGWQTALVAGQVKAVASVERWRALADAADRRLARLGFVNAVVAHDDGRTGLSAAAPFDRIIINAAVTSVPEALVAQLKEAGIVVAPVSGPEGVTLTRFRVSRGRLQAEPVGPTIAAPLASGVANGG
jgi:protein-L-isoaspartate(D-aspartate) O-methyltransferase